MLAAVSIRPSRRAVVRGLLVTTFAVAAGLVSATPVAACSPLEDPPTLVDMPHDQLVVVGTTGDPAPGGRWFHVERWFNGGEPVAAIVIAFKEGEPIGDCSYPVAKGTRLIIAPDVNEQGRPAAAIYTLQAPPDSPEGQAYLAEAIALYGPGVLPPRAPEPAPTPLTILDILPVLLVGVLVAVGLVAFVDRPRRRSRAD